MTSNMTMTAISICNFLKLIVKSTVEHYTEDFKLDIKIFKRYAKEAQETGKPVSMLWFCRSCGTYTRLFIDMDGTLAVWKQAACFEDLLQPGYFRDLPPYQTVLDAVKILCNTKPELDVYALSAYMPENPYAVHEKNAWLDAYLPEIDSEHRIFVACGSSKARAAANRLKTPCIDNSFVLLDDYSVNLHEWKANRGSCIKLRNGINGNGGTWKGESVTRFDTAENIADRIWSIIKKQMQ